MPEPFDLQKARDDVLASELAGAEGSRPNALVFVAITTHFAEMLRAAKLLKASGQYRPVVLFTANYEGYEKHLQACRDAGITGLSSYAIEHYYPRPVAQRPWWDRFAGWTRPLEAVGSAVRSLLGSARSGVAVAASGAASAARSVLALAAASARGLVRLLRHVIPQPVRILGHGMRLLAGRVVRAAGRAVASLVALARRALRAVRALIAACLNAVTRGIRRAGDALRRGFARLQRGLGAAGRSAARALLRPLLSVLFNPFPSPAVQAWARQLPRPVRLAGHGFGAAVGGVLKVLVKLLAPLLRAVLRPLFRQFYFRFPEYLPADLAAHRYAARSIPHLIERQQIDWLVLPEDNFWYFTHLYIHALHARGGKAVVVPFTIVNQLEWAEAFQYEPACDMRIPVNALLATLFPHWTLVHGDRRLIMPASQVMCHESFRHVPEVPWLINSGPCDAIAAESRFMERYYVQAGISGERVRFTGALYDDILHDTLARAEDSREALYRRHGLPAGRPLVLCSLPPNQLRGAGRPQCEFQDHGALLRAFAEPLLALRDTHNIVFSLHPRLTQDELQCLDGLDAAFTREDISGLIPLATIFVASASATIRLAISCGIPVLNYDVYVYNYSDYKAVPGVWGVSRHAEYASAVADLAAGGQTFQRLRDAQCAFAAEQTQLDGKAAERLLELMRELGGPRREASPATGPRVGSGAGLAKIF
jgi:hypothetical protein